MSSDTENDELTLSSSALEALSQFYAESDSRAEQFTKLVTEASQQNAEHKVLSMDTFGEDWNMSQFWYADETATLIAKQLLDGATPETTIMIVSVPSVFIAMKNWLAASATPDDRKPKLVFLEYDRRFAIFPEFVFYDYKHPTRLPTSLKGTADRIAADPPFLNEDCHTKVALTIRWLAKPEATERAPTAALHAGSKRGPGAFRMVMCTGERMETLVTKLYRLFGLRTTDYQPVHARCLNNEYYCYANFECDSWKWVQDSSNGENPGATES
ncbi:hypothetical protein VTK73DRAFT_9010 [Phialemonium thermophilum]|uniref:Protein-lysine N-methyltransferase EFM5 n=1 Tax=Phialemonium thermophilum TaxID=223376 RepID=A0ABR3W524_9PEZI